jgi:hypothetical protein
LGPFCPLEESLAVTTRLDALRADSPRAGEPLTHYVRLVGPATPETLARYRDAGVEHVVVSGGPLFAGMESAEERADTIRVLTAAAHDLG